MLSPVRAASFIAVLPSIISPSTGILSPGLTMKQSPTLSLSTGTFSSVPSAFLMIAVSGASFIRLSSADVVFPLDMASRSFPTVIRVTIIAADSKYRFIL